jgi:hypothetical protein
LITTATFLGAAEIETAEVEAARIRRSMTREEIRSMPIVERPNRPGHFYGNTVRRVHHFRHGR